MRSRLVIVLLLATTLIIGLLFARHMLELKKQGRPTLNDRKLRILTYSTFVGSSGPGTDLFSRFKNLCGCDVEVVTAGDAGLLLERAKLASESVPFDVVIGLDQLMLEEARARIQWRPLSVTAPWIKEISAFKDESFIPYDWSPLGFIYRKSTGAAPANFKELIAPELKGQIALQDPRSSSPGLQFYHWVRATQGPATLEYLEQLKPNVYSVSPSWSFSYGLFEKKQVRFVFSYLTSLAYHWGIEKDRDYNFASFTEGHPVQVEMAAVPADCRQCELAEQFVAELIKPEAQKTLMEKNFMLPVIDGLRAGTVFAELPEVKTIATPLQKDFGDWEKVFKR